MLIDISDRPTFGDFFDLFDQGLLDVGQRLSMDSASSPVIMLS